MKTTEWLNNIQREGLVCSDYMRKIQSAQSKKQLIDLLLDSNGVSFLPEMDDKGFPLPYECFTSDFKSYINGLYKSEHTSTNGGTYDSRAYCCYTGNNYDIEIDTTITLMLGCTADVWFEANSFVKLYVDKNCSLMLHGLPNTRVIVECWGNAVIETDGDFAKLEIIRHGV